jgi:hypothetical protein
VKRSGRDKPVWAAIHMRMEAMLGISLYSYLYLKPAKTLYIFIIISYVFSSTKSEKRGRNRFYSEAGGGAGRWPKQCTHM